jgi:drug/metabolite transporter (DMT)-like permease
MNKVNAKRESTKKLDVMNIILWVLQVLLAAAFLAHGMFFLSPPVETVEFLYASTPPALRLFIGAAEVLAALGLTLPGLTRIQPQLISWAAAGLMILLASASVFHLARGETSSAVTSAILLVVTTFVTYLRWKVKPISPRVS